MSWVQLPRPIAYPHFLGRSNSASPGVEGTTGLLEAINEYVGTVFSAPRDMVISHVGGRVGIATGSPQVTGAILLVGLVHPDGTLWATDTSGPSGVISANSNLVLPLTAPAIVPAGSVVGLRFTLTAGTALQFQRHGGICEGEWAFPYNPRDNSDLHGGPGPHLMNFENETWVVGSSATEFYRVRGFSPAASSANNDWNNTNATIRRGLGMRIPQGVRIVGLRSFARPGGNGKADLWNTSGAQLATGTWNGGVWGGGTGQLLDTYFTSPYEAAAGSFVWATREPTTSTAISEAVTILPSAAYRSAWPWGPEAQYVTFNGSTWSSQTDRLPYMVFLIDQIEDTFQAVPSQYLSLGLRFRVAA